MATFDQEIAAIRKGMNRLKNAPVQPDVFGADSHGFQLNPPLREAAVLRFEKRHAIELPLEYRTFLIQVGNGGAGPHYGVFKLGEMDDLDEDKRWKENDGFIGTLSKPFPLKKAWNDLRGEPAHDMEDEAEYERLMDVFENRYFDSANVNGAIPICHLGCAMRQWLIVTGPEAGNIWCDDRADFAGLYPLQKGKQKRVTFLQWYLSWLKSALRKLN